MSHFTEPSFTLKNTLSGHSDAVNVVAASEDALFLLTGGDDSVFMIWSVTTGENLQRVECYFEGAVTSAIWIPQSESDTYLVVVGFSSGSLSVYRRQPQETEFQFITSVLGHDGAVQDMAYDSNHRRLASVGGGSPQVWEVSKDPVNRSVVPVIAPAICIARSIHFCDGGSSIVVCHLEDHMVVCYTIEPWAKRWEKRLDTRVGASSISSDGKSLFITNMKDGIDEYTFPQLEKKRTYTHTIQTNYILQVNTLRYDRWIIAGGDDGYARLFDHDSGHLLTRLNHGSVEQGERIQVVQCFSNGNCSGVVTASRSSPFEVKVWEHANAKFTSPAYANRTAASPKRRTCGEVILMTSVIALAIVVVVMGLALFKLKSEYPNAAVLRNFYFH